MLTPCANMALRLRVVAWLAAAWAAGAAQAQVLLPTEQPPCWDVSFASVAVLPRAARKAVIQFDIAWRDSWRHDVNHDAIWVFFKFRTERDPLKGWRHVRLAADKVLNPTGYGQAPAGAKLSFPGWDHAYPADGDTRFDFLVPNGNDGFTGVFVRRAAHGIGTASGAKLTVLWDLTTCPDVKEDTSVQLKVLGLHMMYVAEGPYSLGSGGAETSSFYAFQKAKKEAVEKERIVNETSVMIIKETEDTGPENPPYRVASSNAIPTGSKPGRLWARGAEPPENGEIPAAFPNGYRAFYAARYPLTPILYADCLDLLAPEVADERYQPEGFPCHGGISRTLIGEGSAYAYRGHVARKSKALWYMCWADCAMFADWAGLRPMSELEYEKALRGPRRAVPEECGSSFWGGSFGGGRYNAHPREMNVTVGSPEGLRFAGTHGSGTATNWPADWPKKDAKGTGVRGGQEAASGPSELAPPMWCTSCRIDAAMADAERFITYGFRPARTAPEEAKWNTVKHVQEASPLLQGLPEYGE